jgi:hypothetical protein
LSDATALAGKKVKHFRPKAKRSKHMAKALVRALAFHGEHYTQWGTNNLDSDLDAFLQQRGSSLCAEVNKCVESSYPGPSMFINYISMKGAISATGSGVRVSSSAGLTLQGSGQLLNFYYVEYLKIAVGLLTQGLSELSYAKLAAAATMGFAAVEGYINTAAIRFNALESDATKHLLDTRNSPTNIETKLKDWPKVILEKDINRGDHRWQDFISIKGIRDHRVVHIKTEGVAVTELEMLDVANKINTGIMQFLMMLHECFSDTAPYDLIRLAHTPTYEIADV